jgi:hypothetical protein
MLEKRPKRKVDDLDYFLGTRFSKRIIAHVRHKAVDRLSRAGRFGCRSTTPDARVIAPS